MPWYSQAAVGLTRKRYHCSVSSVTSTSPVSSVYLAFAVCPFRSKLPKWKADALLCLWRTYGGARIGMTSTTTSAMSCTTTLPASALA
eukprot:6463525-Amphidinium_carterae.2